MVVDQKAPDLLARVQVERQPKESVLVVPGVEMTVKVLVEVLYQQAEYLREVFAASAAQAFVSVLAPAFAQVLAEAVLVLVALA